MPRYKQHAIQDTACAT